jgi:branched-subunit amino acid aminotransferase/4-amino-4-deoxychorismate lyase
VRANGLAPLAEGFREVYAGGRKAMKHAYRAGVDDEAFHEWRKHVQRHWRHLQLMRNAWPEAIAPRIDLASELSAMIGLDHDLAVLIVFTRRNRAILGARVEVKALVQAARDEQTRLRAAAHLRGQRLYDLPPRAMARMIETNWAVAQAMAGEARDAETALPKSNVVTLARA